MTRAREWTPYLQVVGVLQSMFRFTLSIPASRLFIDSPIINQIADITIMRYNPHTRPIHPLSKYLKLGRARAYLENDNEV